MNITVLGCGRWGTFLAWYAHRIGHAVTLWGRPTSRHLQELRDTGRNEYLALPPAVTLTSDLPQALAAADICIISISSQQLRSLAQSIATCTDAGHRLPFVLCMKGLELGSGKRLSTILTEELGSTTAVAVWVGPGHVQDFVSGMPNCMVMSSTDEALTHRLVEVFTSPLIRFYYGHDLLGTEIGASAKNVMGIAAGMLDGACLSSLKGALMARGTHELSVLIAKLGGDPMTVYGLSHLGDYEATLFSQHSNNRRFGENFIQGKAFTKLAEGVYTTEALLDLARTVDVELPITAAIHAIIQEKKNPQDILETLFLRTLKAE